eukprot:5538508-Pyramimonas_sp.AAC.1
MSDFPGAVLLPGVAGASPGEESAGNHEGALVAVAAPGSCGPLRQRPVVRAQRSWPPCPQEHQHQRQPKDPPPCRGG